MKQVAKQGIKVVLCMYTVYYSLAAANRASVAAGK